MEVNMYTIKEVSNIMDVSEHTLRFWAKSGFFPFIKRDENNIRLFSQSDLEWVKIVKCLRSVGTENKAIKRYIDLCNIGDSTIKERFEIIKATKQKAQQQMNDLKKQLDILEYKEGYYKNLIKNNSSDAWNPMNNLQEEEAVS
jgi:merR family transcription regulator